MAKNKKIDVVLRAAIVFSVVFSLATTVLGYKVGSTNIVYQTEKSAIIKAHSVDDISSLGESIYNDRIYLENDIVITDPNFKIGTEAVPFGGVFDGQGHTITFKYSEANSDTSLFGYLAPEALVTNVNFVYENVTITGTTFGGVAKINDGTIEHCKVTYNSMVITKSGMFSPFVTINRGTINGVVVSGELKGSIEAKDENDVFFGNVCVYNSGKLKSAIVTANYTDLKCTDELNILKGLHKNLGISAIRYSDIKGGTTEKVVAILQKGQFTTDKAGDNSLDVSTTEAVFQEENVFFKLDFKNTNWVLKDQALTIKVKGEE